MAELAWRLSVKTVDAEESIKKLASIQVRLSFDRNKIRAKDVLSCIYLA